MIEDTKMGKPSTTFELIRQLVVSKLYQIHPDKSFNPSAGNSKAAKERLKMVVEPPASCIVSTNLFACKGLKNTDPNNEIRISIIKIKDLILISTY